MGLVSGYNQHNSHISLKATTPTQLPQTPQFPQPAQPPKLPLSHYFYFFLWLFRPFSSISTPITLWRPFHQRKMRYVNAQKEEGVLAWHNIKSNRKKPYCLVYCFLCETNGRCGRCSRLCFTEIRMQTVKRK